MKLKYYLRGLGIGIVVTAIIMSITNKPQELTDAQIKMRALELGMVEESVLADLQAKKDADVETVEDILNQHAQEKEEEKQEEESVVETEVEETTDEANSIDADSEEVVAKEEVSTETEEVVEEETIVENEMEVIPEEAVQENVVEKNNSMKDEVVESYTIIKIEKGNGSEIVSKRLYEAGLVDSEVEYNQFLVRNGYDRKLSVGDHEIPADATEEDIARILCGMK